MNIDLTDDQKREYNLLAVKAMGWNVYKSLQRLVKTECGVVTSSGGEVFDIFTNAADKDLCLEKLDIDTIKDTDFWTARTWSDCFLYEQNESSDTSMTTAQLMCICSVLDEKK